MNNLRVIFLVLLVAGLFAGVIASQAADSGVTPWPSTAEKIRKGEIDVGKEYGMAPDKRFHRIHADTVGLECSTCHADRIPASAQVFSVPPAVDISSASPGAVDRRVCQGCHIAGPAREIYGPRAP